VPARVVDQYAAHQLGGKGHKMRPVLPRDIHASEKTKTHFVDQRRGLQRMPRSFFGHLMVSDLAQFFVHKRNEFIQRGFIAFPPVLEQL
jgi:hypothetical protein